MKVKSQLRMKSQLTAQIKTKILIGSIIACTCFTGCTHSGEQTDTTAGTRSFYAMDTYMTFTIDSADADELLTQAQQRVTELEAMLSVTDENSDIYRINHSDGAAVSVSDETAQAISYALTMAAETDGALDPTIYPVLSAWGFTTENYQVPDADTIATLLEQVDYTRVSVDGSNVQLPAGMMLDVGAIGKGYTGDAIISFLKEQGVTSALLDLGGNIQAIGGKPDGSRWKLGIKNPFGDGVVGVLQVADAAVVTSGSYERYFTDDNGKTYGHIIDPETGQPVDNDLASVTIIGKEGKKCDALSTALFVMGQEQAISYWKEKQDFDMVLITQDKQVLVTEGIAAQFTLQDDFSQTVLQMTR